MTKRFGTWLAVFAAVLLAAAVCVCMYFHFWHIGQFDLQIGQGASESPDGAYRVTVSVCPAETLPPDLYGEDRLAYINEEGLEAYVVATLWSEPTINERGETVWSDAHTKCIYYDRYDGSEVSLFWQDSSTVAINGRALAVPNGRYDYRRSFFD